MASAHGSGVIDAAAPTVAEPRAAAPTGASPSTPAPVPPRASSAGAPSPARPHRGGPGDGPARRRQPRARSVRPPRAPRGARLRGSRGVAVPRAAPLPSRCCPTAGPSPCWSGSSTASPRSGRCCSWTRGVSGGLRRPPCGPGVGSRSRRSWPSRSRRRWSTPGVRGGARHRLRCLRLRPGPRRGRRHTTSCCSAVTGANRVGTRPDSIQLASSTRTPDAPCSSASPARPNTSVPVRIGHGRPHARRVDGDECLLNGLLHLGPVTTRTSSPRARPTRACSRRPKRSSCRTGRAVPRARRPQGLQRPHRRGGGWTSPCRGAPRSGGGASKVRLHRAGPAAARRQARPLVRPQPHRLDELRADGTSEVRGHRPGEAARPQDRGAQPRRHPRRDGGSGAHGHPSSRPCRTSPTSP